MRRRKEDLDFRLRQALRSRLSVAVRGNFKSGSAVRDLGCTIPELRVWLEAKFYPRPETGEVMSWSNYGRHGWHVDHKRPLVSFDLTDREQLLEACNFKNLQPLWGEDNISKGGRWDPLVAPDPQSYGNDVSL
jgi:hypothetical protein